MVLFFFSGGDGLTRIPIKPLPSSYHWYRLLMATILTIMHRTIRPAPALIFNFYWRSSTSVRECLSIMGASVWLLAVVAAIARGATSSVPGVVRFSVIGPLKQSNNEESLGAIMPSVHLAAKAIAQPDGPLPGWKIQIENRNGNCSSTDGPLAAFELHNRSGKWK